MHQKGNVIYRSLSPSFSLTLVNLARNRTRVQGKDTSGIRKGAQTMISDRKLRIDDSSNCGEDLNEDGQM